MDLRQFQETEICYRPAFRYRPRTPAARGVRILDRSIDGLVTSLDDCASARGLLTWKEGFSFGTEEFDYEPIS